MLGVIIIDSGLTVVMVVRRDYYLELRSMLLWYDLRIELCMRYEHEDKINPKSLILTVA